MSKKAKKWKIAVIGAGASGMMAAITAARNGADVVLYEGMDRVGKKILSTGNGKCNFTNSNMDLTNFYVEDQTFLSKAFSEFGQKDTLDFFAGLGMMIKQKNGYYYPASEQAASVLDILRLELQRQGVAVCIQDKISRIVQNEKGIFAVESSAGKVYFDRVILACGGKAAPKTGSDGTGYTLAKSFGHSISPIVPGLVQMICKETYFKSVGGVRSEGQVTIFHQGKVIGQETGEIQFTEYGISGIPVFQVSRIMNRLLIKEKEILVEIDLLPGYTKEELKVFLESRMYDRDVRNLEEFFTGVLNKKLMLLFIKLCGCKPTDMVAQTKKEKLFDILYYGKHWKMTVTGNKGFDSAQVCAGGVKIQEITEHMESVHAKGLFLAGELLDVDGKCGGYNLQWAWTSGYLAGINAAK